MSALVIKTIEEWKAFKQAQGNKTIGFVPTMGYLHEGHKSLMVRSKEENDVTVVSIFVNPLQFGPNEDFSTYPRDLERDVELTSKVGIDVVFAPNVEEMYPGRMLTNVTVSGITDKLCGAARPGHFDGVATVLSKLFHIIGPTQAYFGQKDAQQVAVVEQLVKDLNFPVKIVRCDTVREEDGLAKSSRNVYLNEEERKQAVVLSKALNEVKQAWNSGRTDLQQLKEHAISIINSASLSKINYIEILSYPDMQQDSYEPNTTYLVALAVFFGKTRLIDNCILEPINGYKEE